MKKALISATAAAALTTAAISLPANAGFFDNLLKPAKTEHPIMLIPGIFAFDTIAGVDYWYQIPSALESRGASVHVAKINAFESSAMRGESLIEQLEEIKAAANGKIDKFNLMGHSQGGMTARYVMNVRPDLVASVTTMSTPHTGSPVADVVSGAAPEGTLQGIVFEEFSNAVGNLVNLLSDNKQDQANVNAMLAEFNAEGSVAFNNQFPAGVPTEHCGTGPDSVTIDGHKIKLYSWGGGSHFTGLLDISDPLFAITGMAFEDEANDGITGVCSNHFGKVLRDDYNMNHIDINNHVLGNVSLFETNPKTVFVNHAKRLKQAGL